MVDADTGADLGLDLVSKDEGLAAEMGRYLRLGSSCSR